MIRYITKEDLLAELEVQVAAEWGRWRYVEPPKIVFEPSKKAGFFLDYNSKKLAPK